MSVITPVNADAADHLIAAYDSLAGQRLPGAWEWEWLVHIDGGAAPAWLMATTDARVHVSTDLCNRGPAAARNLLLERSSGSYLKVLDADDQLTAGTLSRDLDLVTRRPDVAWVTSRADDLCEDGSVVEFTNGPEPGPIERGVVYASWQANGFRLPVHPATLFARRGAVVALGGWSSVPTSEDTGLVLALNCCERGWFIEECGLTYRKWAKQLTAQEQHLSEHQFRKRSAQISQRCESLLRAEPRLVRPASVDG